MKRNGVLRTILLTALVLLVGLNFAGAGLAAEGQKATNPRTCGFLRALLFSCPSSAPAPAPAPAVPIAPATVVTPPPAVTSPAVVSPAPSTTPTAPVKPAPAPTPPTPVSPSTTAPSPAPIPAPTTTPTPPSNLITSSAASTTPTPATHPPIKATLLGQTGEDVVGTFGGSPDGVKDVHIKLSGVSGTIKGVRITGPITGSGFDGIWETPANGQNWIVAIRPQTDPSVVDLYFDFYKANSSYTITVTFSDGAMQAFQAVTNNPSSIYLPVAAATPAPPLTAAPTPAPIQPPPANSTPLSVSTGSTLQGFAGDPEGGHWI